MTAARDPLTPEHGARFVLEREAEQAGGARAVYRAAVVTPGGRSDYRAELGDDGSVSLTAIAAPASRDHEDLLAMIAKLTARGAAGRRDDGLIVWPARITRWRGPGRGA